MTDAEWQAARKVPRTKTLRRALGLTQEEFAARYQMPLGTLPRLGTREGRAGPVGSGLSSGPSRAIQVAVHQRVARGARRLRGEEIRERPAATGIPAPRLSRERLVGEVGRSRLSCFRLPSGRQFQGYNSSNAECSTDRRRSSPLFLQAREGCIWDDGEREAFVDFIARNPEAGDVIPATSGVREVYVGNARAPANAVGTRVIYFYHNARMPLFLDLGLPGQGTPGGHDP